MKFMNVEKDFKILIEKYGFKYGFNNFPSFHGFSGPFFTYSIYNEYGCFTILLSVQRNEEEYYVSKKFANNKDVLLFEQQISQQVFKLLKRLRKNPLNWFRRDNALLAGYITNEIKKNGEFFGIKVKNNA